jgi:hypothetical protein
MTDTPEKGSLSTDRPIMRRLALQLSSGKWILTVAVALSFVLLVYAYVKKGPQFSISPDAMAAIITAVFTNYFLKAKDQ